MTNAETTTTHAAAVAKQGALIAPEKATSKKNATQKKGAPKGQKAVKKGQENPVTKAMVAVRVIPPATKKAAKPASKKASKPAAEATEARDGSKESIVLDLLRRPKGATMAEIAKATGWQNHSIRGFISGNLTKKMGLTVESGKNDAGERVYKVR